MLKKIISEIEGFALSFDTPIELYTLEELKEISEMEKRRKWHEDHLVMTTVSSFANKKIHKYTRVVIHQADADDQFLHGHLGGQANPKIDLQEGFVYRKTKKNIIAVVPQKELDKILDQIRQRKPELLDGFLKADNH